MGMEEANGVAKAAEKQRRRRMWRAPLKVVLATAAALGPGRRLSWARSRARHVITGCYYANTTGADYRYGTLRVIDPALTTATNPDVYSCEAGLENTTFSIEAGGSSQLFLKLDGISGPATQKAYKGSVELQSFAAGAEAPIGNVGGKGTGAGAGKLTVQTLHSSTEPLVAAAMNELCECWPVALAFPDLVARASQRLTPATPDAEAVDRLRGVLLEASVLRVIWLSGCALPATGQPGSRPQASPLARAQAAGGHPVISSLLPGNYALADELEGRFVTCSMAPVTTPLAAALDTREPSVRTAVMRPGGRGPARRMTGAACRP